MLHVSNAGTLSQVPKTIRWPAKAALGMADKKATIPRHKNDVRGKDMYTRDLAERAVFLTWPIFPSPQESTSASSACFHVAPGAGRNPRTFFLAGIFLKEY